MATMNTDYTTESLLKMDATEIASLIRDNKLTSVFITNVYINHIKKNNYSINDVVEPIYEDALKEADQYDLEINKIKRNLPLYGVPISIKGCFDVKGMHTTGGIVHKKDIVKTEDAVTVK